MEQFEKRTKSLDDAKASSVEQRFPEGESDLAELRASSSHAKIDGAKSSPNRKTGKSKHF